MRASLAGLLFCYCTGIWAQSAHDEGIAAGRAANPGIGGMINGASASSVVPGYTASPPEMSYYGQADLVSPSTARLAFCRGAPADVSCQAITTARQSAEVAREPVTAETLAGVEAVTSNPQALVGSISGAYSACSTSEKLISPELYETESCYNFYTAVQGQQCVRSLTVQVEWVCPVGSSSGPRRSLDPATGQAKWTCQRLEPQAQFQCPAGTTGPYLSNTTFPVSQVCLDPSTGVEQAAAATTALVPTEVAALPRETEVSNYQCGANQASVTPDMCQPTTSQCTDGPSTKVINDHRVTRACGQSTDTYNCVVADVASDCNKPIAGQCTQAGPPTCIDLETAFSPPVCLAERIDFKCKRKDAVSQSVTNCETQTFCGDNRCWDTGYSPDEDFARVVALLEAEREAGVYLDDTNLTVFNGTDNKCRVKFSGVTNCCKRSAGGEKLNNNVIAQGLLTAAGSLVKEGGQAIGSTYMYDALFNSDAPNWVLNAYSAMFGTGAPTVFNPGLSLGLYGITLSLGGTVPAGAYVLYQSGATVLYFNPVTFYIAVAILVAQELLSCEQEEQVLAMKRGQQLCVRVGSYCSDRILGSCITRRESHCCFNSRLARLLNEQGRAQVGKGWGSARSPDCSGFSVEQLQALDFSRMDLSEFYAEIAPTIPDVAAVAARVRRTITKSVSAPPSASP